MFKECVDAIRTGVFEASKTRYSTVLNRKVTNPITGERQSLDHITAFLNDDQKWSRERIADWIESQPEFMRHVYIPPS